MMDSIPYANTRVLIDFLTIIKYRKKNINKILLIR
jgi:hypothetical protein